MKTPIVITLLIALLVGAGVVRAQSGGGYDLSWGRAVGGAGSTGGGWEVRGTAGQPDAGQLSGGNWVVQGGFLNRVTGNLSPIAGLAAFSRPSNVSLKIRISDLLTNAFDPDEETPVFASVSATSTNGGTVTANGSYVFYNPPASGGNVADCFTYRVKDGFQGQGAGGVVITIADSGAPSLNITYITTLSDSNKQLGFAGIPNRAYLVQAATDLSPPIAWVTLSTNVAGSDGLWNYMDLQATNFPSRYYRSAVP